MRKSITAAAALAATAAAAPASVADAAEPTPAPAPAPLPAALLEAALVPGETFTAAQLAADALADPIMSAPTMGETILVAAKPGVLLRNNETGGFFETGVPTPQTVTVTLLRRLADGDLVRVAAT